MNLHPRGPYTTGDVARLCHVTRRTVIKWIDGGRLKGYHLPASRHRRVAAAQLVEFLRRNKMPHDALPARLRVLVVDDDGDFGKLLWTALRGRYDVDVTASGLEAASHLPIFQPDLILLDIRLPDLSGLEVCRHFQTYKKDRKARILAMSAYGAEIDPAQVRRSGADGFLAKPVKLSELKRRIRSMVG